MAFGLSKFAITAEVTRRIALYELSTPVPIVLILRHAGTSNAAWVNASYKAPFRLVASHETACEARADMAARLAKHALVDWEGVVEDGQPVPFSAAAAERFMAELAAECPDVFQRVAGFATDPSNFRDQQVKATELGKG